MQCGYPRPGLWRRFRSGFALAALAVPLLAQGFRDWLRWLSSVINAAGDGDPRRAALAADRASAAGVRRTLRRTAREVGPPER
jgi:hypothetical protein